MKQRYHILSFVLLAVSLAACSDDYLTTTPQTVITDEQVFSDPRMIEALISDNYTRLPQWYTLQSASNSTPEGPNMMSSWDEALPAQINIGNTSYDRDEWELWDNDDDGSSYGLIRDLNRAIARIEEATSAALTPPVKASLTAELRFQRAWTYFEMVKRMGGVPLITTEQIYDFSGDPSYLQSERDTEAAVYEFVSNEMDAIAGQLGNAGSKSRANRYTALALKSRAMLYAGSLARHNNEMPNPITLPGGIVGIPASKATEYYTKSLEASRAIITSGAYSLYNSNPHPGENFYEAVSVKSNNPEVIWAKDYAASAGRAHTFTIAAIPRSLRLSLDGGIHGSWVQPNLQIAENFDYLDGSSGTFKGVGDYENTVASQSKWIFYDNVGDIFANKDGRFYGTIMYPGTSFSGGLGGDVDMQAGVQVWNESLGVYERFLGEPGSTYVDGLKLTGSGGPVNNVTNISRTGFYLRKFVDSKREAALVGIGSDIWWVRFRLGEIYMNAAEAAFELGLTGEALGYINTLRERAGFPANSLTTLSREKIRSERWAELALEDHRIWDMKRWRIAHLLLDGTLNSRTAHHWVLFGFRVYRPGHPNHNKYVYDDYPTPSQSVGRRFEMYNYYSAIPNAVLGNNPKLVQNPFH